MATTMDDISGRIVGTGGLRAAADSQALNRPAGAALLAAGIIFLAGSIADYLILWVINGRGGPQWEYAAVTTTVEGMSRIVLGIALIYGGLHLRARSLIWVYRVLGVLLILMALGSAALGALMAMDYLSLQSSVRPEAAATFRNTALKTLFLCAVYFVVTLPAGIASLRAKRAA